VEHCQRAAFEHAQACQPSPRMADDDVEAHRFKVNPDESTEEADDDDDTPDVEAHRHKL